VTASKPSLRELAQKLLADQRSVDAHADGSVFVNPRLRLSLIRFAGVEGFASLLRRAMALASANIPALRDAKVSVEGEVEGIVPTFAKDHVLRHEAAVAVSTHLLELLVAFIGESLTRRFVDDAAREPSSDE
jgi:hypothetical protein